MTSRITSCKWCSEMTGEKLKQVNEFYKTKVVICLCTHDRRDHEKKEIHKCMICSCQSFSEKVVYKNARSPCECVFCWRYKRQPRNFDIVHLIEALMDSANQLLVRDNIDGAFDRIHRAIGICRELIRAEPTTNFDRCRFRNNPRMRCNLPLVDGKCTYHGENPNHDFKQLSLDGVVL